MKKKKHSANPILTLPEPCDMLWEAMQGGEDGKRFCAACDKHVHDLSSMTKRAALSLLDEEDWQICVNYEVDPQGNMLFQPEPPTRLQLQLQGAQRMLAAAALVPLALAAACDNPVTRLGGEPLAITHTQQAHANPPEEQAITTSSHTARLIPGAGLEPSPPDTQEDPPACDGIESDEPPAIQPVHAPSEHPRLGGKPMKQEPPRTPPQDNPATKVTPKKEASDSKDVLHEKTPVIPDPPRLGGAPRRFDHDHD